MMLICATCHEEFERPGRRGRIPKICPTCRFKPKELGSESTKKTLDPKERVDRLEILLKASNLHISQHRQDFE